MNRKQFKEQFNILLEQFFQEKLDTLTPSLYNETLQEWLSYVQTFQQWGKRIRPYMVYLLYTTFVEDTEHVDILPLSMSTELIHLFALVHDDIIDQGSVRHNNPTYHKYYEKLYSNSHIWSSQALLVGDLLYTRARENLHTHTTNTEAKTFFARLLEEVIVGQMVDVHLSASPLVDDITPILEKDKQKSWYYTFTRPMMLGGILADVDAQTLDTIQTIGTGIALAFQLRDDLLDVTDPWRNKTCFSDLKEWNQTVILHKTYQAVSAEEKAFILQYRWKDFDTTIEQQIFWLIEQSWAIQETKTLINDYLDEATHNRKQLIDPSQETYHHLLEVIDYLRV